MRWQAILFSIDETSRYPVTVFYGQDYKDLDWENEKLMIMSRDAAEDLERLLPNKPLFYSHPFTEGYTQICGTIEEAVLIDEFLVVSGIGFYKLLNGYNQVSGDYQLLQMLDKPKYQYVTGICKADGISLVETGAFNTKFEWLEEFKYGT